MTTSDSEYPREERVAAPGLTELIAFALDSLPAMRRNDGIFCFERHTGNDEPEGRSLRYTLMVALGLARAKRHGYDVPMDPVELYQLVLREIDSPEIGAGDLGLLLWADARLEAGRGGDLVRRLDEALATNGGLPALVGMELGWIVTGLAHQLGAGSDAVARGLLDRALHQLISSNQASSGLFRHAGRGWRGRFPNFATQIYSVLALAAVARHSLDDRALPAARVAADCLLELQLPDGAWPWLFDAERGTVVERYEIYSVHQDAMAPMALLELADVAGEPRYAGAALRGLAWIHGVNERGADMVDRDNGLVLRSIRRRHVARPLLAIRALGSRLGLSTPSRTARLTQLNPTDRPYAFGWVLEAWCGRENGLRVA